MNIICESAYMCICLYIFVCVCVYILYMKIIYIDETDFSVGTDSQGLVYNEAN